MMPISQAPRPQLPTADMRAVHPLITPRPPPTRLQTHLFGGLSKLIREVSLAGGVLHEHPDRLQVALLGSQVKRRLERPLGRHVQVQVLHVLGPTRRHLTGQGGGGGGGQRGTGEAAYGAAMSGNQ